MATHPQTTQAVATLEKEMQEKVSIESNKENTPRINKNEPSPQKKQVSRKPDPLLDDNDQRFVLFPIKYDAIWEMYKKHLACFWTAQEVDLTQDLRDWKNLNEDEKHFIKMVLAFFAASDGIVLENLASRFISDVQVPEARCFYGFQLAMENIHSETYSLLIDTYISDTNEKTKLFQAMHTIPCIKKKAEWAMQYIDSQASFAIRLIAFAIVEGVFFSGSFCAIFWMKKRQLMPGLTFSNELISRDEGLHCDFACLLYSMVVEKVDHSLIKKMMKEAVEIEKFFVCESLPVNLIGMNAEKMSTYIEFIADRLLDSLGVEPIWKVQNPFEWMEIISLQGKTNFFDKKVAEYQRANVMASLDNDFDDEFSFDCDF